MKKFLIIGSIIVFVCLVIAMFYTPKYPKFNKDDWNYKTMDGPYSRRYDMLNDLLTNYHLKGMNVPQLRNLLGSNDLEVLMENDTLKMEMNVFTENGKRPARTKDLILYLDKDSVVTSWKVKEYIPK